MVRNYVDKITFKNMYFGDQIPDLILREFKYDIDRIYKKDEIELIIYSREGGE